MSVATNSSIENSLNSNIGRRGRENAAMSDNTSQMGNGMSGGVESKITLPSHFCRLQKSEQGTVCTSRAEYADDYRSFRRE